MLSTLLLLASITPGQCAGGACAMPARPPVAYGYPAYFVPPPPAVSYAPPVVRYSPSPYVGGYGSMYAYPPTGYLQTGYHFSVGGRYYRSSGCGGF